MLTAQTGTVEINGVLYLFVPVNSLGVRDIFEDWIKTEARKEVWKQKKDIKTKDNPEGFITPEEWEEERARLQRDINAQVYSWGTEQWGKCYHTIPGQKKILEAMFRLADPRFDSKVSDSIYDPQFSYYVRWIGHDERGLGVLVEDRTDKDGTAVVRFGEETVTIPSKDLLSERQRIIRHMLDWGIDPNSKRTESKEGSSVPTK